MQPSLPAYTEDPQLLYNTHTLKKYILSFFLIYSSIFFSYFVLILVINFGEF